MLIDEESAVDVWDTSYVPVSEAFSFFREGTSRSFLPWSTENRSERQFEARLESVRFENGLVGRIRSTPTQAIRTNAHIADSKIECVYASLRLFGNASIEQGKNFVIAKPGDLVIFDSSRPTTHAALENSDSDAIALVIPKTELIKPVRDLSGPYLIQKANILDPFLSCFSFITHNMYTSSRAELNALFDACVNLLPVAMGCYGHSSAVPSDLRSASRALREIVDFIDENLENTELSARCAAGAFSISERYVHKLFSTLGITFSFYVTRRRLEHVSADLLNTTFRRKSIALVAYRWGFNDLSTFNRAFKELFGCSPRQFRACTGHMAQSAPATGAPGTKDHKYHL